MISSSPSAVTRMTISSRFGGAIGTDEQPSVGILADVVDDDAVFDGVEHVVIADAVAPSRWVDLHMGLMYYKTRAWNRFAAAARSAPVTPAVTPARASFGPLRSR